MRVGSLFLLTVMTTLAIACSSGSGSGGGAGGGGKYSAKRSPKCKEMADAFCDWAYDKCQQGASRAECDEDATSLFCTSDAAAQSCIDAFATAACGQTVSECTSAIDRAPAVEFCSELIFEYCDAISPCQGVTADACKANGAATCVNALGVAAGGDECLTVVGNATCENQQLPPICEGVVKTSG